MNNNDLLFLKILADEHNLTKTAKKLFISQPAITDKIKKLEKEFGTKLIIRKPRGIEFTPEGDILAQYAIRTLKEFEKTKDLITNMHTDELHGSLHISCSNVFAKYHLPKLLSDFQKLYPKVEITFKSGFSTNLYRDFLRGESQLAILRGDHLWSQEKKLLLQEPLCIFSAFPLDLDNLPEVPYIHYSTDPNLQTLLDEWWGNNYQKKPHIVTDIDSMDTGMKLVQNGLGYTILSESCGSDTPGLYKYPLKLLNKDIIYRKTWLYYRSDCNSSRIVKTFIYFILKKYRPIPL